MKKIVMMMCLGLIGCQPTPEGLKEEIRKLKYERDTHQNILSNINSELNSKSGILTSLTNEVNLLKATKEGKPIKYMLTFELGQSHFTLDIGTHLKDAANTVQFSMAVDKEFYDSVNVNQDLVNSFREGSLLFKGSFGSWHVVVVDKKIVY